MSERMTDESLAYHRKKVEVEDGIYGYDAMMAELDRARASEVEKDAQIKAMADALALVHREGLKGDMGGTFIKPLLTKEEFTQVTDALHLCGRLP